MASRPGAVFIDSNIFFYAAYFQKENIFEWITALYEKVYVHQEVLNELLDGTVRNPVQELVDSGVWVLFNPENADCLSDALITSSNLICSNDYDIAEVISDEEFKISFGSDEEEESELIIQDTLEDFCYFVVLNGIAARNNTRRFLKMACHDDSKIGRQAKLDALDRRLEGTPKHD